MAGAPSAATMVPTRRELRSQRRLLLVAGTIYLAWWFVVQAVLPGSYNAIAGRLVVVAVFFGTLAATFVSEWTRRHIEGAFVACVSRLTIHYYYLFHRNGGHAAGGIATHRVVRGGGGFASWPRSAFAL